VEFITTGSRAAPCGSRPCSIGSKEDFTKNHGSVEKFVAPYLSGAGRRKVAGGGLTIAYGEYDWSLNDL